MIGQEKGGLLIQVTAWAGMTISNLLIYHVSMQNTKESTVMASPVS